MNKKIGVLSGILSVVFTVLLLTGNLAGIMTKIGYWAVDFVPAYRYNFLYIIALLSLSYAVFYSSWETVEMILEKIKVDKKNINVESVVKLFLCIYILVNTIPRTQKYGFRATGYLIFPLIGYWVIKNRKKIRWDITDLFLVGFWLSIYLSSFNAIDRRSVISEFKDAGLVFLIPLFLKQLNYGEFFKKILLRVGVITICINTILGYFEKINLIYGRYWGARIAADSEVWRYAGLLMLGIVFFIYNIMCSEKKAINSYALVLSGIVMLWTQNRANWVAILAVTFIMLMVKNIKKGIIISLALAIVLGIGIKLAPKNNPIVQRFASITDTVTKDGGGEQGRKEIWKESISMFETSPVIGIGYSPKNFALNERPEGYRYLPQYPHQHSHSSYLYILATMGIVGSFFFLGMNFTILYTLFKDKTYMSYLGLYLFISWMVMGLFETPVKYTDMMGTIFLVIGIAISNKKQKLEDIN